MHMMIDMSININNPIFIPVLYIFVGSKINSLELKVVTLEPTEALIVQARKSRLLIILIE